MGKRTIHIPDELEEVYDNLDNKSAFVQKALEEYQKKQSHDPEEQMEKFMGLTHKYPDYRKKIEEAQENETVIEAVEKVFQKQDVKVWDLMYNIVDQTQPRNIDECNVNFQHCYIEVIYDYEHLSDFTQNKKNITKKIYYQEK